ncbi:MAG: DUF1385 domain-containing protein [Christensenellaceae bacterium]|nr:DUF1385 domain-containing protein [Christensenellaceae bacterium]
MSKNKKRVDIGGQAVIEGVMMKSPDAMGIAVRKPNGDMVISHEKIESLSKKYPWTAWPFIRGIVNFALMMILGMNVLQKATNMLGVLDEEPSKFEIWLSKKLGKSVEKVVMAVAIILAILLSILIFFMIPESFAMLLRKATNNRIIIDLGSGLIRILILILYMVLVSFVPDVKRTFMYHGAEHKTVYCHENNLPLTVENVKKFSRLHPRCGTSFILIVFIVSILLFTVVGYHGNVYYLRLLSRLALMPFIAGISYELLKGLAHNDSNFIRFLRWPGLKLQLLTTKEPTDDMLECAIVAMNVALYGEPESIKNEDGYSVIKDYRQADPILKDLVDNENI